MTCVSVHYFNFSERDNSLPAAQQARLEAWLARYFEALGNAQAFGEWRHIPLSDAADGSSYKNIDQNRLAELADEFTERWAPLRDPKLEWLVADSLCYAEVEAFREIARLSPFYRAGKRTVGSAIMRSVWSILIAIVWIALLIALWDEPLAAAILVIATVVWHVARWPAKRKKADLGLAMLDTYNTLASTPVCWPLLWESMGESRRAGAVWNPAMYRLVDYLRTKH